MAMSASGATIAVHLPAQSHVSTRSLWLALCSVWRAAMHTALQVRPPWLEQAGGMGSQTSVFLPVCLFAGSLHQSQCWIFAALGLNHLLLDIEGVREELRPFVLFYLATPNSFLRCLLCAYIEQSFPSSLLPSLSLPPPSFLSPSLLFSHLLLFHSLLPLWLS